MKLRALLLAAPFLAATAHAADLPVPYNHVEFKQSGNTYKWQPLTGNTPGGGGVIFRGNTTVSDAEPKISTHAKLPYDKRPDVPLAQQAKVASPFTKRAFGKALTIAGKALWPIGVVMAAGEIIDYMHAEGLQNILNTADGITADVAAGGQQVSDGKEYLTGGVTSLGWRPSSYQSCQAYALSLNTPTRKALYKDVSPFGTGFLCNYTTQSISNNGTLGPVQDGQVVGTSRTSACPAGWYISSTGACSQHPANTTLNQQQIEDLIASKQGWGPAEARALQRALNTPGVTLETGSPTVTGPATTPGSSTTTTTNNTTDNTTTTTTTTNTTNNTYNGDQVKTTNTTTTTTNVTNNTTGITTTVTDTTEVKEDDKEEETPTDTPLPGIPELYQRKYPDGIVGIWNDKKEQIKQSSVFTLADQLMPKDMTSGNCPAFQVDLNFASWASFGSHNVAPPCYLWTVAKTIIIVSALMLARALIFGG